MQRLIRHEGDDPLSVETTRRHGAMLMAFDQGAAIHWLILQMDLDVDTMREGMNRMLSPTEESGADEN